MHIHKIVKMIVMSLIYAPSHAHTRTTELRSIFVVSTDSQVDLFRTAFSHSTSRHSEEHTYTANRMCNTCTSDVFADCDDTSLSHNCCSQRSIVTHTCSYSLQNEVTTNQTTATNLFDGNAKDSNKSHDHINTHRISNYPE